MADLASGSRDDVAATLALAQIPGIGAVRLRQLLSACGGAAAAVRAPHAQIAALPGFSRAAATAIREVKPAEGEKILKTLDTLGARALLADDPDFPPMLAEVPDPPPVLFAWGDLTQLAKPAVAFVGSRDCTEYGVAATRLLAGDVAATGQVVVVSGMARGIDAAAHEAALDAGGGSVGVLGNGFGVIYPSANRLLYQRMVAHGCLITEHGPGERPHAGAFPRRNRLVSGLARVTVVVEAAATSGALITADCALDQGRGVLAVPGPITSARSVGCIKLIQQGAKPVLTAGDILEEMGLPRESGVGSETGKGRRAEPPGDLDPLQRALWDALGAELKHVDQLVVAGAGDVGRVLTALTDLELRGIVRQEPGMRFGLR
ncbi:MAG TPA: DNA-processing protein DprA [Gemmatimonadales bacterium]|nr:DNA-processing protein DprA [Gemmatimonadales bacterium]